MATVFDTAAFILAQLGSSNSMKVHRLVYFAQAWHIAWHNEPLFMEELQAWANGPIAVDLYDLQKGNFTLTSIPKGDFRNLSEKQKATIQRVLAFYGDKDPQTLSDLTQQELPWQEARQGYALLERGNTPISLERLIAHYASVESPCHECGKPCTTTPVEVTAGIGPDLFTASVPLPVCECGAYSIPAQTLRKVECKAALSSLDRSKPLTGPVLRFARKALDLSHAQLAERLEVSREDVFRWEVEAAPEYPLLRLALKALLLESLLSS